MLIPIIGIDCATQKEKTAIALGIWHGNKPKLIEVYSGKKLDSIAQKITQWIAELPTCLLALDAPLGWPEAFSQVFPNHQAGQPIHVQTNQLFQRETDRFIQKALGKRPLEVGAERIARTAHAALNLLEDISRITGRSISTAWEPIDVNGLCAIEVYPAGTLSTYNIQSKAYKKPDQTEVRGKMIEALSEHIHFPKTASNIQSNADCLDASICVLAGADFLRGNVFFPKDARLARKEGWIWVKKK